MDLIGLIRNFIEGQPQAYSRTTRTPIYWNKPGMLEGSYAGQYNPISQSININPDQLPQNNPNMQQMSGILRHEQVHALLPGSVTDSIEQYYKQNPQKAQTASQELQRYPGYSGSDVPYEAPAYLANKEYLGQPVSAAHEYASRMPDNIRKTYLSLIGQ